ncbi:uncharacterized protein RJT21DRAFT_82439 [Scheffersomyces amazonensis]|uniref:uncharacterized protein n=1 Tax=Scheffersomyces amazonensis TaxID=1078765 RepID=UPI00315D3021
MNKRKREDEVSHIDSQRKVEDDGCVCNIPPCHLNPILFKDYLAYESHITTNHTFICQQCHRRFPSNSILTLHIDENHNPFLKIKQERGDKVFRCIESECSKVCRTPKTRRLHMIEKHNYPKEFRFDVINRGL